MNVICYDVILQAINYFIRRIVYPYSCLCQQIQALKAQLSQLKQMTNAQQQGDPNLLQPQEADSNDNK